MTDIRAELREYLLGWFGQYLPANPLLWYDILVLCWLAIFAIILHLIIRNSAKHFLKGRFSERIVQPDAKTPADLAFKLAKERYDKGSPSNKARCLSLTLVQICWVSNMWELWKGIVHGMYLCVLRLMLMREYR